VACSTPSGLDGFESGQVTVGDEVLRVALASTSAQRNQGLSGVTELPPAIDGMLFVWDQPTSTTFHMREVSFPLDVWFFDMTGQLIGSARMETCPDGVCNGYATPGPVMWALETPADEWDFGPGTQVSNVEKA
jgi:uncharacterized membrane protein (UPF0127 family)